MLRACLPPEGRVRGVCPVCLAVARSERETLARAAAIGGGSQPGRAGGEGGDGEGCVCPAHLCDAALMDRPRAQDLLAGQARCQAAALGRPFPGRRGGHRARWLRGGRSPSSGATSCPACRARVSAARQELGRCEAVLRPAGDGEPALCVRHVLALRAADPGAARAAAGFAARQAGALLCELAEAFRKGTWTYRHESRGTEATAWRRAAGFLDGPVFGGCPPGQRLRASRLLPERAWHQQEGPR